MDYDFMGIHDFWIYVGMVVFALVSIALNLLVKRRAPRMYERIRESEESSNLIKDDVLIYANPSTGYPMVNEGVDCAGYPLGYVPDKNDP